MNVSQHKPFDNHTLTEMIYNLRNQINLQNALQYAYDKQFSEYVLKELNKIKKRLHILDDDSNDVLTLSEQISQLRYQIKTGNLIPIISKFKINQLFK